MRVAIFDFDGTLYTKETFKLLMQQLKKHPVYQKHYNKFFRSILPLYIRYKIKLLPEREMKERSMKLYLQALETLTVSQIREFFKEMQEDMLKDFNEDVVGRLAKHRADGLYVLLVSGAYTPFLEAVTSHLSFDHIIGTEIPTVDGKIDMNRSFLHIQGERKNEQIFQALEGEEIDWNNSYAYGDSFSDLPVLEQVGHPVAVRPEPKLAQVAAERNWVTL